MQSNLKKEFESFKDKEGESLDIFSTFCGLKSKFLQKPWWVRFKVWLNKTRRGFAEYKQERRQRLIEKEKEKQRGKI